MAAVEHAAGVEARDDEVGHRHNRVQHLAFGNLLLNLTHLPGGSRRAQDHIHFLLTRLRNGHCGLYGLNGIQDGWKRVEYCKKCVHALMLENDLVDSSPPGGQAIENKKQKYVFRL